MKLLIEIWGNYHAWKKVTYSYNNKSINSSTTLPLLYNEIQPDKTIVIVADTLIENEIAQNKISSPFTDYSYSQLCQYVHSSTIEFITSATHDFCPASMRDSISVVVTPAVGTFAHTQFKGNPNNFFSYLYYYLAKTAIAISQTNNDNIIEIYLDITHGINYMTMITYRTIKDICTILAHFYNITFIVLNSDPFVGSENIELNINQIEKVKIKPQLVLYRYPDFSPLKVSQNMDNCIKSDINKSLQHEIDNALPNYKDLLNNLYPFTGAIYNATPIFIIYFFPDIKLLYNTIESTLNLFFRYFKINNTNRQCILHQVDFTPSFITLLQSWLFSELLASRYKLIQSSEITIPLIHTFIDVFSDNNTLTSRIYREVDKIKKIDERNTIQPEFTDYGKILMGDSYIPDANVDQRNFFAHAGFSYTITQLKRESDTIYIKPKDEAVDGIRNTLINSIPMGVL